MKIRIDQRIATFTASAVSLLSACNGKLAVVDDLNRPATDTSGGELSGGSVSEATPNLNSPGSDTSGGELSGGSVNEAPIASCGCASSESLQALGCGSGEVPLVDSDIVQTTADGSVVAFTLCATDGDPFACDVFYWTPSAPAFSLALGTLIGLSASGDAVLVQDAGTGMLRIGPNGRTTSVALSVLQGHGFLSADGNTVVGAVYDRNVIELARANVSTGEIDVLGELDMARSVVNPDASAIVGWSYDDGAFRWSEQGLTLGLPGAPANTTPWVEALSADGSVIAGQAGPAYFRWSEAGGYVEIASASGRSETWISADGSVVVGSLHPDGNSGTSDSSVFRWTEATGAVEIAPGASTMATDMSDDGSVVVATTWEEAQNDGAPPKDTLVWDTEHGTRSLADILRARGIDASGWTFERARVLSGDGKVLLGRAHCGGALTLYRLVLSED